MLNTLFQQQEGPQVIRTELNLGRLRILVRCFLSILVASTILYTILYGITPDHPRAYNTYLLISLGYQACFILIAPFLLFYVIALFIGILPRKEREQRRQAAALGDQRFLALDQPIFDLSSLSLPFTVKLQPDWSILLSTFAIMLPGMSLLALVWSHFRPDPVFDGMLFIISGVLVISFGFFLFWKLSSQKSIQLVATENGLALYGLPSTVYHLHWKDIRLFAIDAHLVYLNKKRPTLFFEVASAQEVIHWTWKLPTNNGTLSQVLPEEYDRQMQALFSLIVAQTGLPLCDLRRR